jgi:hypothetical protein
MLAIAQVVDEVRNQYHAQLLTGEHAGSIWIVISSTIQVHLEEYILVEFQEQDQFVHPIDLKNIQESMEREDRHL